jgi:tetratricopeptide (TPR) repeat protein
MFVIRQNQKELFSEGERWLKVLKAIQPNAPRTAELEARLAMVQGNENEASRILREQESKPNAPTRRIASVYEELKLFKDAGRLYKELGDQSKRPEALLIYAAFLGRQKQTDKALDRCDEARAKGCSVLTLTEAGVLILYDATNPRPNEIGRVLSWVAEGLASSSAQAGVTSGLLNQQAAIFNLQGKYDDAIAVYERLLAINPRDSLAMNNLGYLLAAHKHDFATAFNRLSRAKGISGPLPEFLDTEALIHLARAKAEASPTAKQESAKAALKLLADVEVQAPSAVTYVHLALAKLADDPGKLPGTRQSTEIYRGRLHPRAGD